nr:ATP-binding cassette domain-containing protein [uncultured Acetatifactor sp.]
MLEVGGAAEVIGMPDFSIGGRIYLSKVYLDTAGVLAWTAVVIVLSVLFEKLVRRLLDLFFAWEPACRRPRIQGRAAGGRRGAEADGSRGTAVEAMGIAKIYDGQPVLKDFHAVYQEGETYYLTSPSGSGKTTLLHILAGLIRPDGGYVSPVPVCSMVFQEDRLCEDYNAVKNVELVTGDSERAREALRRLLGEEALHRPCRQLSGGMRRRVALVRAMEADSECVLLDEPFTGMDAGTRRLAEIYIRERQDGRIILIATHI